MKMTVKYGMSVLQTAGKKKLWETMEVTVSGIDADLTPQRLGLEAEVAKAQIERIVKRALGVV